MQKPQHIHYVSHDSHAGHDLDLVQVCLLCKVFGFGKFFGSYTGGRAKMRASKN